MIENQFETSDHRHLGQILTYLVGTEARTVVWIAERIREEHRAVIDGLNETTPLEYAFFRVELEVWRIGDSVPAPRLEVVARPNDWVRRQKERNRVTEMEDYQRRMEFWGAMLDRVPSDFALGVPARAPNQGWMKFSMTGEDALLGCGIYCYRLLGKNRVGVYLSLGRQDPERTAEWLAGIAGYRLVDGAARKPATGAGWEINRSQLLQFFVTLDADAMDETDWPRQHDWMISQASAMIQDWRSGLRADVMRLIDAS
ncbi:hypothetical protein Q4543_18735 [Salipiger sp. 1_MG-2023]|uniref:hypothetical protein n=1 Tax=Salipiger sp. 1_MG-2023 TaxID=3062665 RepID=UPI0026E37090|nr:hypothetical protein [Salipiger sp. 1_MG-2023]MDO6587552.1 hypothetical protein [Salipiger sp. 1_MG-2023]